MLRIMSESVGQKPFVFRTDQAIEQIVRDLKPSKLNDNQQRALRTAVGNIASFWELIQNREAKSLTRRERLRRAKRIEKLLGRLRSEVENNWEFMSDLVPSGIGKILSESLTFAAISKAMGEQRFPNNRRVFQLIDLLVREDRLTAETLEFELHRRNKNGRYGHILFRAIVIELHRPFSDWVEEQRSDEGGLRPEWKRELVLDQLIKASQDIIGRRATQTQGGKFELLCDAVLRAFGRPTTGLHSAIAAALKRRKLTRVVRDPGPGLEP